MHIGKRPLLAAVAALVAVVLAGCGADRESANEAPAPGSNAPVAGPFQEIDRATRSLVSADAHWEAPASLDVEQTVRIGLAVGEGEKLKSKIDTLLKDTKRTDLGPLEVGPTVRATLRGNPEDVEITPAEAVDATTGSDVQMLWTWLIHPKHPTDGLPLTAQLEVPLSNGHTITHEVALTVEVRRTMKYTLWEVATHWGTWSAVVTSLIGAVSWLIRRRRARRQARQGGEQEAPEPSVANATA